MLLLRLVCIVIFISLSVYTAPILMDNPNLLPLFFGQIGAGGWQGQFNLDFMFMLSLSALWTAWRHRFTPAGLGLALLAGTGGALFLSAYLFVQSWRCTDVREILIGR